MNDVNYLASGERKSPKKLIRHCIVCKKKKHLLFYCSTGDFILQICNKCLDALGEQSE